MHTQLTYSFWYLHFSNILIMWHKRQPTLINCQCLFCSNAYNSWYETHNKDISKYLLANHETFLISQNANLFQLRRPFLRNLQKSNDSIPRLSSGALRIWTNVDKIVFLKCPITSTYIFCTSPITASRRPMQPMWPHCQPRVSGPHTSHGRPQY